MAYTTINKSSEYFNIVTYSGNGSTQSITGVGFQPDWVWIKTRNTAGFSIVKYTGTGSAGNVGHGLSTAPKVLINKSISGANDWFVGHSSIGFTKFLKLNDRIAATTNSGIWNDTAPTTDHFTINSANGNTNSTGVEYITYCFSEIKGFSKFGSYIGNGSTDGVFCYTGMKPAFLILKNISSGSTDWIVYDNKRSSSGGNNVIDAWLAPHSSSAEVSNNTANNLDFLSNGFKLRHDNADLNASGSTYIYIAFAEQPLVGTNNIPATAR